MLQELNQEQYLNDVTLFIKRIERTVKEDAISYTFETIGEWYFPLIRCTMKGGSLGDGTIVEEAIPDQYLFVGYR
nr:MAG TPA: Tryptophan operon leader peptide [Caudoviricetes sp.]